MRLTVYLKSEALTGLPFEYLRPLRRWRTYLLPPSETFGRLRASPGMTSLPDLPAACL
jgi:hypothetical protein